MVCAFEPHVDSVGGRARPREQLVEEGAFPACRRDCVLTPRFADRQGPLSEAAVARALERDGTFDGRERTKIVARQRQCPADGSADLERPVMLRQVEVAPNVMQLGRGYL